MKTLQAGDIIPVRTNAELLNTLLGTTYKAWMKTIYHLGNGEFIWIVEIDGKVRSGWSNTWQNGKIVERYVYAPPYPRNIYDGLNITRRAVFEKCTAGGRHYIFRGIFQLEEGATLTHRVLSFASRQFS